MAVVIASPAWSGQAGDLLAACQNAPGTEGDRLCQSYINGFFNGILAAQIASEQGTPICMPDYTNTNQIREIVSSSLKAHPEALTFDTGGVLG